jgi:hypothetical protein
MYFGRFGSFGRFSFGIAKTGPTREIIFTSNRA